VHHRTIQINHQPDATVFQFIILTFVYSSTWFGNFPAHYQEPSGPQFLFWIHHCHSSSGGLRCSNSVRLVITVHTKRD